MTIASPWAEAARGVLVLALIGGTFALAEWLHRARGVAPEPSRKVAHVASAAIAAGLPALGPSIPTMLAVGLLLAAALIATQSAGWMRSIHGVDRRTVGGLSYLAGVFALYALLGADRPAYFSGVATLGLADAAAALAGGRARSEYRVFGERLTLAGSGAFLLTAWACIGAICIAAGRPPWHAFLLAAAAAVLSAATEAVSRRGTDNFTEPLVAGYLVHLGTALPLYGSPHG